MNNRIRYNKGENKMEYNKKDSRSSKRVNEMIKNKDMI